MTEFAMLAVAGVLIIVAVSALAPRIGVAVPVLLVMIGAACSFIPGAPVLEIEPEWILAIVLPPILYSAAVNMPVVDLRRNVFAISGLSVVLVVVSAFAAGTFLFLVFPDLDFAAAVALGAVVSPPDAVAATAIGKRLGLPHRLVTILEGEGLLNDATALVMLRTATAAVAGSVSLWGVMGDFARAVVVGAIVGLVIGLVTVWVRSHLTQPVLTTAISLVVPFLAYNPAELLHASGVLAVVVAGLVTGHESAKRFTASDRVSERTNWRTVQLILENGVFLVMGFEIRTLIADVEEHGLGVWLAVAIGLVVTLVLVVVRFAFVFPFLAFLRVRERQVMRRVPRLEDALSRLDVDETDPVRRARYRRALRRGRADAGFYVREGLAWRGGVVLSWSGMRGVVTLAAAQSLPAGVPYRSQLVLIAFTVAVVTLVVQGGTLPYLIRVLRIAPPDRAHERQELATLMTAVSADAQTRLRSPNLRRDDGRSFDPEVVERIRRETEGRATAMARTAADPRTGPAAQLLELRRIVLDAQQAALNDARVSGLYSSTTLLRAQSILDAEAVHLDRPR
ncbi:sodium:proton antiporter [Pseudoclavibacter chungangensis]|uniref:Sodium:proton antiporter n=1 Tax=Pseudoclavibacter chungangensis TaxID=587635 RepID=A0A7J5BZJ1_9MICO|nr:sodium:proton antiporter [Pseudoclavibacter chungangensis]KAB1660072.1 sodium:proton antiporter [Pseudoclavibacter chungangensis]NYJ66828.1 CPA1 family monovalent cation:H+ antiporter [Pseudoclavibacter chungangensis]